MLATSAQSMLMLAISAQSILAISASSILAVSAQSILAITAQSIAISASSILAVSASSILAKLLWTREIVIERVGFILELIYSDLNVGPKPNKCCFLLPRTKRHGSILLPTYAKFSPDNFFF